MKQIIKCKKCLKITKNKIKKYIGKGIYECYCEECGKQKEKVIPRIIAKVWKRQGGKYSQKLITIPALCNINEGDHVEVIKLE